MSIDYKSMHTQARLSSSTNYIHSILTCNIWNCMIGSIGRWGIISQSWKLMSAESESESRYKLIKLIIRTCVFHMKWFIPQTTNDWFHFRAAKAHAKTRSWETAREKRMQLYFRIHFQHLKINKVVEQYLFLRLFLSRRWIYESHSFDELRSFL